MPPEIPETSPDVLTVAIAELPELQMPPDAASVNDMDEPEHTGVEPVIVPAIGAG